MKKILLAILLISNGLAKAQWTNNGTPPNYTFVHYLPTTANVVIGASANQNFKLSINGSSPYRPKVWHQWLPGFVLLPDQSTAIPVQLHWAMV